MPKRLVHWIWPLVLALGLTAFVVGLQRGEFATVSTWAHTLCTSCIGLGK